MFYVGAKLDCKVRKERKGGKGGGGGEGRGEIYVCGWTDRKYFSRKAGVQVQVGHVPCLIKSMGTTVSL